VIELSLLITALVPFLHVFDKLFKDRALLSSLGRGAFAMVTRCLVVPPSFRPSPRSHRVFLLQDVHEVVRDVECDGVASWQRVFGVLMVVFMFASRA
jgi:hypothetical protein